MGLIEAGHRLVNSTHIIMTESGDGTPKTDLLAGRVRVTVLPGQTFELDGEEAEKFLRDLKQEMRSEGPGPMMKPIYGRSANPPSDAPVVPVTPTRKRRVKPGR